jgi:SAM-dependent methyltransferase
MAHHVERAAARAARGPSFSARLGAAHDLPAGDGSVDAVLLMGPLYHLFTTGDRVAALREARRVLRPGGRIVAEVIARPAWLLDATRKRVLDAPGVWETVVHSVATGMSQDPSTAVDDGAFWAYFHQPDELRSELVTAGFTGVELVAVEGFAWLLDDLEGRMADPAPLLRAVHLAESDPSMLGCSAHVVGIAIREGG